MASQEPITPRPDAPQSLFKIAGLLPDGDANDGPRRLYFERGQEWYAEFAADDVVHEWRVPDDEPPFYEGDNATVIELAPGANVNYVLSTEVTSPEVTDDQFELDVRLRTTAASSADESATWRCFSYNCPSPFRSIGMRHSCYRC